MSAIPRQVERAVSLIISGGIAAANYGPEMEEHEYNRQVFLAVARSLSDYLEAEPEVAVECAEELLRRHKETIAAEEYKGHKLLIV